MKNNLLTEKLAYNGESRTKTHDAVREGVIDALFRLSQCDDGQRQVKLSVIEQNMSALMTETKTMTDGTNRLKMPNSTSASTMMQARVIAAVFAISLPKSIPRKRQARIAAAKTFRPERTGRARRFLDFDYFNIRRKKNQPFGERYHFPPPKKIH